MPFSKKIVIIGGDLVGLELAEFLAERGRSLVILEPGPSVGENLSIVRRSRVVHMLKEYGVEILSNANIKEITSLGVSYNHAELDHMAAADQVIIAMGANSNLSLANSLEDLNINMTPIGDCKKVGYIHGAIADARNAVINF
jgi:2,4-dienoyl-CoA reductase (NADPH2)